MKKYWRISLLLFLVVVVGCQQQLQFEDDLLKQETLLTKEGVEVSPTGPAKQSTLKENGLPELTFKTNEKGNAILVIKDHTLTSNDVPVLGKIKITDKAKGAHFIEDSFAPGHNVRLRLQSLPAAGSILQAEIQYFNADSKSVKSYNYEVYVFEDGTAALQKPTLKFVKAEMYAEDIRFSYGSGANFGLVVENDPGSEVAVVEMEIQRTGDSPAPIESKGAAKRIGPCDTKSRVHYGQCWVFSRVVGFTGNPLGFTYTVKATMNDVKGKAIGESVSSEQVIQKADFTGRIRRVRVRQEGDGSNEYKAIVVVENADTLIIAKTEIVFNEPFTGPKPLHNRWISNYANNKVLHGRWDGEYKEGKEPGVWSSSNQIIRYTAIDQFSGDAAGFTYNVTATMIDFNGKPVGEPVTMDVIVEAAPFKGVAKVAIIETSPGSNNYFIGALILNIDESRIGFVEMKFVEPFGGPKPNQTSIQLKKRPDILFQAWDDEIETHLSEIQNNPLHIESTIEINPLFEQRSAIGSTYTVVTTVFNLNGKPIGESQSFEVKVQGEVASDEPVILSSTLTSKDKGLTWDIAVTIDDKGKWVEKAVYEFVKPYDGPAPMVNPISLTRTGEATGTVEVYTATGIKFEKSPEGFSYGGLIYQFGIGTRTTTSQANNKAELL